MDFAPPAPPMIDLVPALSARTPVLLASPHSGQDYLPEFLQQTRLDPLTLRRSEDSYVDQLFGDGPAYGIPLLRALFPRAWVDPNRAAEELDPLLLKEPLPDEALLSPHVQAGLGVVPRVVAAGTAIYAGRLNLAEMQHRIQLAHAPYHRILQQQIDQTMAEFGCCLLLDCHSMPSRSAPGGSDSLTSPADIVLGDNHGRSCSALVTGWVENALLQLGYRVVRNRPYAGGYTTCHYGRPDHGCHVLQIEISRRLYMDEVSHARSPGFSRLRGDLAAVLHALTRFPFAELRSCPTADIP